MVQISSESQSMSPWPSVEEMASVVRKPKSTKNKKERGESRKAELSKRNEVNITSHVKFDEGTNLLFYIDKGGKQELYSFEKVKETYPSMLIDYFKKIYLQ